MGTLILLLAALAAPSRITAVTVDGQQHAGQLQQWDDQGIVLVADDGSSQRIAIDQVQQVLVPNGEPATAPPPVTVTLVDGSVYHTGQFQVQKGVAQTGSEISIPAATLRTIRWKELSGSAREQWEGIAARQHTTDAVVVQRETGALDYVGGIVGEVTDEHLRFEFNGQSVELPRGRTVGIVYASSSHQFPRPRFRLRTAAGDLWNLDALAVHAGRVEATSQAGIPLQLPWDAVERIDVMAASFTYLSDLEPLRSEWQPYWAGAADPAAELFAPAKDTSLLSGPLVLPTGRSPSPWQTFNKGLSLHSRSEMEYRLQGKFRRLTAWAGLDPRLAHPGSVKLQIWADDRLVYEKVIDGGGSAARIDVDLAGAERLRLLVDFHDRQDLGDYLNLCDAKLWE